MSKKTAEMKMGRGEMRSKVSILDLEKLKKDNEFESLLPDLLETEHTGLEASIRKEGLRDYLVAWTQDSGITIVDGYRRLRILEKMGVTECKVRCIPFTNRDAALNWARRNQIDRRNLTPEQMAYLCGRMYNDEKNPHGGTGANQHKKEEQRGQNDLSASTATRLSEVFGVSEPTVKRNGKYSAAIDKLNEVHGKDFVARLFNGSIEIPKQDIVQLAGLSHKTQKKAVKRIGWCARRPLKHLVDEIEKEEKAKTEQPPTYKDVFFRTAKTPNDSVQVRFSVRAQELQDALKAARRSSAAAKGDGQVQEIIRIQTGRTRKGHFMEVMFWRCFDGVEAFGASVIRDGKINGNERSRIITVEGSGTLAVDGGHFSRVIATYPPNATIFFHVNQATKPSCLKADCPDEQFLFSDCAWKDIYQRKRESSFELRDDDGWPDRPPVPETTEVSVPAEEFLEAVKAVEFAAGDSVDGSDFKFVQLEICPNSVVALATDRTAICWHGEANTALEKEAGSLNVRVERTSLVRALKYFDKLASVSIQETEAFLLLVQANQWHAIPIWAGSEEPDGKVDLWEVIRSLNKEHAKGACKVKIRRNVLLDALRSAAEAAKSTDPVKIIIDPENNVLKVVAEELREGGRRFHEETIQMRSHSIVNPISMTVSVQRESLLGALKRFSGTMVDLSLLGAGLTLMVEDDSAMKYLTGTCEVIEV